MSIHAFSARFAQRVSFLETFARVLFAAKIVCNHMSFKNLPSELLVIVLSKMSDFQLERCRRVSKLFYAAHKQRNFTQNGRLVRVRRFDTSRMQMDSLCCIIGNRASGRTTLANSLAQKAKLWRPGSRTYVNDHVTGYRADDIAEYTSRLRSDRASGVVVLDDCFYQHDQWRRPVESLRECHASVMMTGSMGLMGDFQNIARRARYVFLFSERILSNQKRLFEAFGQNMFPSQEIFMQVLQGCASRRGECLVLDMSEKTFFWHRDHD